MNGAEDRDGVGVGLLGCYLVGPFEGNVGVAGQVGLVDDLAVSQVGEASAKSARVEPFVVEDFGGAFEAGVPTGVGSVGLVELELNAGFGDDEIVDGGDFGST